MDSWKFNKGHSYNHQLLSHDAWEGTGRKWLLGPWCVAVEGLEREAATVQDVALKQCRKCMCVPSSGSSCLQNARVGFLNPVRTQLSMPPASRAENGVESRWWRSQWEWLHSGITPRLACLASSRAVVQVWSWCSVSLLSYKPLQFPSPISVFWVQNPLVRLPPPTILCDTQALPGLQVAVIFKSMMQKPQSLPLIFCQAAGFLSARQVPWMHMSRGALARHSWNTLIFKNQFCSSSFIHVYKVYRVGQASLEVEFHCQASKLIPFAEGLKRSVGGFNCKACHVARCLPQVTQAIRFHRPSDCSFPPPLPSLPAPQCPLLLFASPFPRHTISKTKKRAPHSSKQHSSCWRILWAPHFSNNTIQQGL